VLSGGIRAPSTLGSFLRSFTWAKCAPAGEGEPRRGRKSALWTSIDRDYETLRIRMQTLFDHLGIMRIAATAAA
jgi:hypothetical protein